MPVVGYSGCLTSLADGYETTTRLRSFASHSKHQRDSRGGRPPPSPRLRPYKALPRPSRPDRPALVAPEIKGTESRGPVAFAALRIVAQYSPPPGPCPIEKEDERNPMFGWGKGT